MTVTRPKIKYINCDYNISDSAAAAAADAPSSLVGTTQQNKGLTAQKTRRKGRNELYEMVLGQRNQSDRNKSESVDCDTNITASNTSAAAADANCEAEVLPVSIWPCFDLLSPLQWRVLSVCTIHIFVFILCWTIALTTVLYSAAHDLDTTLATYCLFICSLWLSPTILLCFWFVWFVCLLCGLPLLVEYLKWSQYMLAEVPKHLFSYVLE